MTRVLTHARRNLVSYLALFIALSGTSYAAFNLPAGSVGTRELKNRAITAVKLNPSSVAASVRAWAILQWTGVWRIQSSTHDIRVTTVTQGETVSWRHTHFARNCIASVTPITNFVAPGTVALDGFVTTSFDGPSGVLAIDGFAPNGERQPQSVTVLIVCPPPGRQTVNR